MTAYGIASYTITDPEAYRPYPAAALATLVAHGAEILVADYESEPVEGSPGRVTVVVRFESKEAARRWYESEEYRKIRHLRTKNSEGSVVLCDALVVTG